MLIAYENTPLEPFTLVPTTVLLRFERWDDVLKLPAPDPALQTSTTMWHFAQGTALAETGRLDDAESRLELVRAAAEATPPDAIWAMPFNNRTRDILTIATHVLSGSIDDARGLPLYSARAAS